MYLPIFCVSTNWAPFPPIFAFPEAFPTTTPSIFASWPIFRVSPPALLPDLASKKSHELDYRFGVRSPLETHHSVNFGNTVLLRLT